ncbi:hypothetical protein [Streptomyces sp. TS71-3]|uniref:hypothetical protein n=1 Tax=Streptomyces sp. TS71-3 TaxID=2733862 RepID=UPI001BB39509|nr:hypothetical protein [Streptomyces sp. TS71-3]
MDRPEGLAVKGEEPTKRPEEADGAERAAESPKETGDAATTPQGAEPTADAAPGGTTEAGAVTAEGETVDAGAGDDVFLVEEDGEAPSSDVAQGTGAVVAAALGFVSLTGSWLGTVAGARESLVGQLQTSQGASVSKQIHEVYGDQWHVTALISGIFALAALIVGVVVLAKPAFGAPGERQASWIKSVSWAGVVLGVIGLLLAVLKYSDAILGLPSVSS